MTSPRADQLRKALKSPAVRSLQAEKRKKRKEAETKGGEESELTRGLKDSFPASDPVSAVNSATAGEPRKKPKAG